MAKKKKSKKPFVPPIPQLSLEALDSVQNIERYAKQQLGDCQHTGHFNSHKGERILRTCAVQVLKAQLDYYESLPIFHPGWVIKLQQNTIESAVGMLPDGYQDEFYEQFRNILWDTTYADLNPPKSKKAAVKTKTLAEQIDELRSECRITVEDLAAALAIEPRSVYRHLSNKAKPRQRQIAAYEKLFSEHLDRSIKLKTSG